MYDPAHAFSPQVLSLDSLLVPPEPLDLSHVRVL